MAGPTGEQVAHYVEMFRRLGGAQWTVDESMCWTVVRPLSGTLSVDDVVRRLRGDPATVTMSRPAEEGYDDTVVFIEQRDDVVVLAAPGPVSTEDGALVRLSESATVHGVFWLVNNFSRLYHAVDGVLRTELDVLDPADRWGADPEALTGHLDALRDRQAAAVAGPDWETAMATVESLTGVRLDAEWFHRPQFRAVI